MSARPKGRCSEAKEKRNVLPRAKPKKPDLSFFQSLVPGAKAKYELEVQRAEARFTEALQQDQRMILDAPFVAAAHATRGRNYLKGFRFDRYWRTFSAFYSNAG